MQFGFKKIIDTSPLSLKNLNDQLEMIWVKLMGGITAQDFQVNEGKKLITQNADVISLMAGERGRVNYIRNGRGEHGLSGYETEGVVSTVDDETLGHKVISVSGWLYQYGLKLEVAKLHSFSCLLRKAPNAKSGDVVITLFGQKGSNAAARDIKIFEKTQPLTDKYEKVTVSFTTPEDITSAFLEVFSREKCLITDIQLTRGMEPLDWVAAENEVFSSGIEVFGDRVSITSSNFSLKILDPLNPNSGEPKLTMSADMNGFDKLSTQELRVGGMTLAKYDPTIVDFYVSSFYGSDVNAGTSSAAPLKTIGEALRRLPYITNIPVYILLRTGDLFFESINAYSFPGQLRFGIYGYGSDPKIFGKVIVEHCGGLFMEGITIQDDRPGSIATIYSYKTPVNVHHCTLIKGSGAGPLIHGIGVYCASGSIGGGAIKGYNVGLCAEAGSIVNMRSVTGSCYYSVKASGSIVTGIDAWPNYMLMRDQLENGGVVLSAGTCTKVSSIDYTASTNTTKKYVATTSAVFANGQRLEGVSRIYHGRDSDGVLYYSTLNYGNAIYNDLQNKSIMAVRLNIYCGGFAAQNTKIHVTGLKRDVNSTAQPVTVTDYGYVGNVPSSGAVWMGLPTQVALDFKAGTINAIGLYDTEKSNYFWAYGLTSAGPPAIEITYM